MSADSSDPVFLVSVPTEIEAGVIVGALEQNGIRATATGGLTAGFRAEAPGVVSVLVAQEDLAEAKELLDELRSADNDIDWSQVDVGEPE